MTAAPAVSADPVSDSLDDGADSSADGSPAGSPWAGGPVEFDRIVPASGNMAVAGRQFWLGPIRSGQTVRFWASVEVIHLMIGGVRIKSVRSHLTTADLAVLAAAGAVNAGPPPLPVEDGEAVEIERTVSRGGTIAIGGTVLLAAEILAGRRIGIRIEPGTLMMFDLDSRDLLRVRPNPLNYAKIIRLRGVRPAGPPPRPSIEPVRAQRRASNSGVIMICGQKSPSAESTPTALSPSTSPRPRWPSSWPTATPASCDGPPPSPCVTSKPTGHDRPNPKLSRPDVKDHLAQIR